MSSNSKNKVFVILFMTSTKNVKEKKLRNTTSCSQILFSVVQTTIPRIRKTGQKKMR